MSFQQVIQTVFNSLQSIALYSLATFGITLVFRTSIATNYAQGVVATFGCYVSTHFALYYNVPLPLAIILGMLTAFFIGMLIDVGIIRRGKGLNPGGKQIVTMGLLLVFTNLIPVTFSLITTMTPASPNFSAQNFNFSILGLNLYWPIQSIICTILAVVLLGTIFIALKYTKWGLGVRATASNETVSQMMGINTRVITALSWAIASALATVSAVSMGTVLSPGMMGKIQIYGFLAIVLGGVTSFFAPVLGAIMIPLVMNFAAAFTSVWADAIVFTVVLVAILIRPNGLFGKKMIKKV
jgi:branched-chain amino acid transport system permease protein